LAHNLGQPCTTFVPEAPRCAERNFRAPDGLIKATDHLHALQQVEAPAGSLIVFTVRPQTLARSLDQRSWPLFSRPFSTQKSRLLAHNLRLGETAGLPPLLKSLLIEGSWVEQENLLHGTLPWRAAHERRTVLYKYSPNAVAFSHQLVEGEQGFI
jgi:hypothetical protein